MNKNEKYYLIQAVLLEPYVGDRPEVFLVSPSDIILDGCDVRTSWIPKILNSPKDVWVIPDVIDGENIYIEYTEEVELTIWENSIDVYDIQKYKVTEITKESYFSYKLIVDSYEFFIGQLP